MMMGLALESGKRRIDEPMALEADNRGPCRVLFIVGAEEGWCISSSAHGVIELRPHRWEIKGRDPTVFVSVGFDNGTRQARR